LDNIPDLRYDVKPLNSVRVRMTASPTSEGKNKTLADMTSRCELSIDGSKWMQSTGRFWGSMFSLFGISGNIFRFFDHQEVLDRICERRGSTDLRFCTDPAGQALAVSSIKREPVGIPDLRGLVRKHGPRDVQYRGGVVTMTMVPKSGMRETRIGPDLFRDEYVVDVPVDGYGGPSTYLSMFRIVCLNGAVARVPEFRSDVITGKDEPIHALSRALDTFSNEEGFSALRERYEAAQRSPASVRECLSVQQILKGAGSDALGRYEAAVGDLRGLYGMANLNGLSEKRQRVLPAKCTVYDLINVASETATHDERSKATLTLEAWIGSVLREEYDLEGVNPRGKDFQGLFGTKSPAGAAKA
jgi:hypothetical protein